jgi:AcrR family transcriptional regulator
MAVDAVPGGLRARRRRFTEDEIERAAIDLFVARGFDTVTVREIADAVDISERTFYRYFPTKEAVLRRELDRRVEQLQDALDARPPDEPVLAAVHGALLELAEHYEADRARVMSWSRVRAATPGLDARLGAYDHAFVGSVTEMIAERLGVDPASDLRARTCAAALLAATSSASTLWLARGADGPLVPMVRAALELVETGLRADLEQPKPRGKRPLRSI